MAMERTERPERPMNRDRRPRLQEDLTAKRFVLSVPIRSR